MPLAVVAPSSISPLEFSFFFAASFLRCVTIACLFRSPFSHPARNFVWLRCIGVSQQCPPVVSTGPIISPLYAPPALMFVCRAIVFRCSNSKHIIVVFVVLFTPDICSLDPRQAAPFSRLRFQFVCVCATPLSACSPHALKAHLLTRPARGPGSSQVYPRATHRLHMPPSGDGWGSETPQLPDYSPQPLPPYIGGAHLTHPKYVSLPPEWPYQSRRTVLTITYQYL